MFHKMLDWQLRKGSIVLLHRVQPDELLKEPNTNWTVFAIWQLKLLNVELNLCDPFNILMTFQVPEPEEAITI